MKERVQLNPNQAAALRALQEGLGGLSIPDVAVGARLRPTEARVALADLEQQGLAVPGQGQSGELLYRPSDDGRMVANALVQMRGIPSVGTVLRIPQRLPSFLEWLRQRSPSYLEIVPGMETT